MSYSSSFTDLTDVRRWEDRHWAGPYVDKPRPLETVTDSDPTPHWDGDITEALAVHPTLRILRFVPYSYTFSSRVRGESMWWVLARQGLTPEQTTTAKHEAMRAIYLCEFMRRRMALTKRTPR